MPHKQVSGRMATAQNIACSCLFAEEPAQDKQRTVNVRIRQFTKTLNHQPQNKLQVHMREDRSIIFYNLKQTRSVREIPNAGAWRPTAVAWKEGKGSRCD